MEPVGVIALLSGVALAAWLYGFVRGLAQGKRLAEAEAASAVAEARRAREVHNREG